MKIRQLATLALITPALLLFAAIAPAHAQTAKVLYNFGSHQGDPTNPTGILAQGHDGSLYGTSLSSSGDTYVYKITRSGTLTTILRVLVVEGVGLSASGLSLGTDGNFYGVLANGGANSLGAVVKVSPEGSITMLYSFSNGADGEYPAAPPILGIDGNFYGTSAYGGGSTCIWNSWCGSLYQITPSSTLTILHEFDGTDGAFLAYAPLFQATDGTLYGTAIAGGPSDGGTIFRISPSGKFKLLQTFDGEFGGESGAEPSSGVTEGPDGNLYGTTSQHGPNDAGEVFKITPNGTFAILHAFNENVDGFQPYAGLVLATDGNFYGATLANGSGLTGCGGIYRISPAGSFATLYTFPNDGSAGCRSETTLLQHTDGLLYRMTTIGGTANQGVFFSLDIGAAPFVTFLPAARQVGHTVEILGQGLTGTTAVSFNGTPATTFNVYADTYMTATIPSGATTGFITVTTPGGRLTSNKQFQVKPQITSFSPASGAVGTSVVITGVSLAQTSKITFGSVVATTLTVNSDTQVTVTVPAGAATTKIGLTTTGAPVYTASGFTVTP